MQRMSEEQILAKVMVITEDTIRRYDAEWRWQYAVLTRKETCCHVDAIRRPAQDRAYHLTIRRYLESRVRSFSAFRDEISAKLKQVRRNSELVNEAMPVHEQLFDKQDIALNRLLQTFAHENQPGQCDVQRMTTGVDLPSSERLGSVNSTHTSHDTPRTSDTAANDTNHQGAQLTQASIPKKDGSGQLPEAITKSLIRKARQDDDHICFITSARLTRIPLEIGTSELEFEYLMDEHSRWEWKMEQVAMERPLAGGKPVDMRMPPRSEYLDDLEGLQFPQLDKERIKPYRPGGTTANRDLRDPSRTTYYILPAIELCEFRADKNFARFERDEKARSRYQFNQLAHDIDRKRQQQIEEEAIKVLDEANMKEVDWATFIWPQMSTFCDRPHILLRQLAAGVISPGLQRRPDGVLVPFSAQDLPGPRPRRLIFSGNF